MRAEAQQFEAFSVRLAVNEDQIGADMAVAMIVPFANQGMIDVTRWQERVGRQNVDRLLEERVEFLAEGAGFLAPIIPLEAAGVFNRPH